VTLLGEGPRTVVFGNGFGTGQSTWGHQVAALQGRCRLVRFDYLGAPDADPAGYSPERHATLYGHADDVVALLEELDVRDALFVGHSMSAMVGALVAVAAPERVARLVFISGSPRYIDAPGYRGGFSEADIAGVLASAAADYHAWAGGFSPVVVNNPATPHVVEAFAAFLRRMRPDVARATLAAAFLSDFRELMPRVRQPTLVIQPSADMAVPLEVGRYLAEVLPSATLREISATGHLPHVTAPEQVTALLEELLAA
jgi:sigma-B regulation protein RsbQ